MRGFLSFFSLCLGLFERGWLGRRRPVLAGGACGSAGGRDGRFFGWLQAVGDSDGSSGGCNLSVFGRSTGRCRRQVDVPSGVFTLRSLRSTARRLAESWRMAASQAGSPSSDDDSIRGAWVVQICVSPTFSGLAHGRCHVRV